MPGRLLSFPRVRTVAMTVMTAIVMLTACTAKAPQPPQSQTPFPPPKSSGPSSPETSPSPQDQDVHDAVKAYYDGYDEVIRLLRHGGQKDPTPLMKKTMTGDYLNLMTAVIQPSRYIRGVDRIDGYSIGAHTRTEISITGCENESKIRVFDSKTNKDITPHENSGLRVRRVVAAKGGDGQWRVDHIVKDSYVDPADWKSQDCMRTTQRPS